MKTGIPPPEKILKLFLLGVSTTYLITHPGYDSLIAAIGAILLTITDKKEG